MINIAEPPPLPLRGANLWPLSVAAYHALGEAGLIAKNTELLYGLVYTKMPKSPLHAALVLRLMRLIEAAIPPGHLLRPEQPITCADSEPEPDLSVVQGGEADYWHSHPTSAEFVVEICVTSHEYDCSKLKAYALAGVKECWLVLAPENQIEAYRAPMNGGYAQKTCHGPGGEIISTAIPTLTVDLAALFSPAASSR